MTNAHAKTPPFDGTVSIAGFGIPLGAWLVSCVLLVLAHVATRSSAARRQRRWVGGCARRRWHNFGQRVLWRAPDVSHRLEACATHLCLHALAGPTTALACCSGRV